jgi:Ribonuclease HII
MEREPGYEVERELAAGGAVRIAGVDEVGRGSWAGPVMVGVVVVRPGFPVPPAGLTDSKRLAAKRREALAGALPGWVEAHATGQASHEEINASRALRRSGQSLLAESGSWLVFVPSACDRATDAWRAHVLTAAARRLPVLHMQASGSSNRAERRIQLNTPMSQALLNAVRITPPERAPAPAPLIAAAPDRPHLRDAARMGAQ